MITVIIPAMNEEPTIGFVVQTAWKSAQVSEVIVVDDKSLDNTVNEARKAGATIITSTRLGKGTSMMDGVLMAKNELLVFLDADITTYPENVVDLLAGPLLADQADFVKSFFTRQAGRVTELVAKPLLHILYPGFPNFHQPLSGMIAGRKSLLAQCQFEDGYGVDIGILIDMFQANARIVEVNIGNIENRMQPLEQLGKMSREVARTIMKKSKGASPQNLETYENIQVIREQMEFAIQENLVTLKKLAVFDMDNTILRESFINTAARAYGFMPEPVDIVTNNNNPFIRTKMIARLMKGRNIGDLLNLVDSIAVTPHLQELIDALKAQGYITGIISDSYDCVTNHLRNRFGFDFTISNELEFSSSVATGEVKIPSFFVLDDESHCKHEYCKMNALIKICRKFEVDIKNTLVIGDRENDICMIRRSGIGISFCATNIYVDSVADYVIKEPDFSLLVPLLN